MLISLPKECLLISPSLKPYHTQKAHNNWSLTELPIWSNNNNSNWPTTSTSTTTHEIKYLLIEICHFRVSIRVTFDIIISYRWISSNWNLVFCILLLLFDCVHMKFVIYHRLIVLGGCLYYVSFEHRSRLLFFVTNQLNYICHFVRWEFFKLINCLVYAWFE